MFVQIIVLSQEYRQQFRRLAVQSNTNSKFLLNQYRINSHLVKRRTNRLENSRNYGSAIHFLMSGSSWH
jgi:hypothetical protein